MTRSTIFLTMFLTMVLYLSEIAQAQISHKVSFEGRNNNYFEVESRFPLAPINFVAFAKASMTGSALLNTS